MTDDELIRQLGRLLDYTKQEYETELAKLQEEVEQLRNEISKQQERRLLRSKIGKATSALPKSPKLLFAGSREDYFKSRSPYERGQGMRIHNNTLTQAMIDRTIYCNTLSRAKLHLSHRRPRLDELDGERD